jgi:predicted ArsR family transcriptional regulator
MTLDNKILEEKLEEQGRYMYKDFMVRTINILDRMKKRFGPEVYEVVEEMVAERTLNQWSQIAKGEKSHTAADIIRLLWEPLKTRGFEFTVEYKEDGIQVYCTKCALYDLAREINGTDWMFYLNCGTDPHIVEGFNSDIGFRRTKTLMEGHDCCDHFYAYPD